MNPVFDPVASTLPSTAKFPSITVAGNVTDQVTATTEFLDEVDQVKSPYTELFFRSCKLLPFWDETAAVLIDLELATSSTKYELPLLHEVALKCAN